MQCELQADDQGVQERPQRRGVRLPVVLLGVPPLQRRGPSLLGWLLGNVLGILVDDLDAKTTGSMAYWLCQNGQQAMFGNAIHQVDLGLAHRLVDALVALWNGWR